MKKFRVALLANLKKNAPHEDDISQDRWADLDSEKTVNALVEAVRAGGHSCDFLEGDVSILDTIRKYKPDICFNICEGHYGDAQVPGSGIARNASNTLYWIQSANPGSDIG